MFIIFTPAGCPAEMNKENLMAGHKKIQNCMYYIYILQSQKDKNLYTGMTTNLRRRLNEHNAGKNISTKQRKPFKLIYYEAYCLKNDAESREKYLKTSMGKRVIKKQLKNYLEKNIVHREL